MQFLTETTDLVQTELTEEEVGGERRKFYYLSGICLEGETQNHNGRFYPRGEIEKAVNNLGERIRKFGPVVGELDHPEGLNINFDRIAVAITDIRMDGNNGVGKLRVIPAGLGLIIEGAIKAGVKVGVSRRGSGSLEHTPSGVQRVRDYDIVTIDAVINPSAPSARLQASLAESVANNRYGAEAMELTKYVQSDPVAQKYLEKEITKFLMSIRDEVQWRK